MARQLKDVTFDYDMRLKDAGLVAASAAAQVGGADCILNLGAGRVDGRIILDITAVEVATGDERFDIICQVSSSATFASGNWNVGAIIVGDSSTSLETVDSTAGRRELCFTNEVNGTVFQYLRLYTRVVGTIATGINYSAFAALKA